MTKYLDWDAFADDLGEVSQIDRLFACQAWSRSVGRHRAGGSWDDASISELIRKARAGELSANPDVYGGKALNSPHG
jgi:hypothetical protein